MGRCVAAIFARIVSTTLGTMWYLCLSMFICVCIYIYGVMKMIGVNRPQTGIYPFFVGWLRILNVEPFWTISLVGLGLLGLWNKTHDNMVWLTNGWNFNVLVIYWIYGGVLKCYCTPFIIAPLIWRNPAGKGNWQGRGVVGSNFNHQSRDARCCIHCGCVCKSLVQAPRHPQRQNAHNDATKGCNWNNRSADGQPKHHAGRMPWAWQPQIKSGLWFSLCISKQESWPLGPSCGGGLGGFGLAR